MRGDWGSLISASRTCNAQAASIRQRRRRRSQDCVERRAARAEALVHMGELSSAKQALEGEELAPGSRHTLDESKRPRRCDETLELRQLVWGQRSPTSDCPTRRIQTNPQELKRLSERMVRHLTNRSSHHDSPGERLLNLLEVWQALGQKLAIQSRMEWDLVCPGWIQVSLQVTVGPIRLSWMHVGGCTNPPQEHGSLHQVGWIVRQGDGHRCRSTVPPTCE